MTINFEKMEGLVPAVIQHAETGAVLMLAYMSPESVRVTKETGRVTFFSRSRGELWTKGETSTNYLEYQSMAVDCDGDALLVQALPAGPVCHTGAETCWGSPSTAGAGFLSQLEQVISDRAAADAGKSYTRRLLDGGPSVAGQKVGEEAVETVIAALAQSEDALIDESADLVYHLLVLLRTRGLSLRDVTARLEERHKAD